jgi:Zn-dependent protease
MGFLQNGAFRLFRVSGINVYLHWTWLLVAFYVIESGADNKTALAINAAVYVSAFAIVLLHEFGHAFACRSVGGIAERIILWPLGGIAFAAPPPRAGAVLWTIAAGPLVNLALLPILWGAYFIAPAITGDLVPPEILQYIERVAWVNTGLLVFNLLPIYPLDGGQILQSLLWFVIGRPNSLRIAGAIGILISIAGAVVAVLVGDWFLTAIAAFVMFQAFNGIRQGNFLSRMDRLPRREELHCPHCQQSPVIGDHWLCQRCREPFDIFERNGFCPSCGHQARQAPCTHCGRVGPIGARPDDEVAVEATLV